MIVRTEQDALRYFEQMRWPKGVVCVRCGRCVPYKHKYTAVPKAAARGSRRGLYVCRRERKQFTVTVGTILSHRHVSFLTLYHAVHILEIAPSTTAFRLSQLLGLEPKTGVDASHAVYWSPYVFTPSGRLLDGPQAARAHGCKSCPCSAEAGGHSRLAR